MTDDTLIPGESIPREEAVRINEGRETTEVEVTNTGDRPIQVGSHFHFFEVNRRLSFDREAAFGMRLDIPAGAAIRLEPGDTREVELVELGGAKRVTGLNDLTNGSVEGESNKSRALKRARREGFEGA
jgi:urease beta subunit